MSRSWLIFFSTFFLQGPGYLDEKRISAKGLLQRGKKPCHLKLITIKIGAVTRTDNDRQVRPNLQHLNRQLITGHPRHGLIGKDRRQPK